MGVSDVPSVRSALRLTQPAFAGARASSPQGIEEKYYKKNKNTSLAKAFNIAKQTPATRASQNREPEDGITSIEESQGDSIKQNTGRR